MGMWAFNPWDNDAAADWYGDLMDKTRLRDAWLEGISQDAEDSPDEVRAASALFIMLGRVYIWPIDHLDDDLDRAIAALTRVSSNEEYASVPALKEAIVAELAELQRRKAPASTTGDAVASPAPARPWWRFWN